MCTKEKRGSLELTPVVDASAGAGLFIFDTPKDRILKRAQDLRVAPNRDPCLSLVELFKYAGAAAPNAIEASNILSEVLAGGDVIALAVATTAVGASLEARKLSECQQAFIFDPFTGVYF